MPFTRCSQGWGGDGTDMAEVTSEACVVALDRRWPDDMAGRNGDLLDIVFDWPDCSRLRRLVAGRCAAAGGQRAALPDRRPPGIRACRAGAAGAGGRRPVTRSPGEPVGQVVTRRG